MRTCEPYPFRHWGNLNGCDDVNDVHILHIVPRSWTWANTMAMSQLRWKTRLLMAFSVAGVRLQRSRFGSFGIGTDWPTVTGLKFSVKVGPGKLPGTPLPQWTHVQQQKRSKIEKSAREQLNNLVNHDDSLSISHRKFKKETILGFNLQLLEVESVIIWPVPVNRTTDQYQYVQWLFKGKSLETRWTTL